MFFWYLILSIHVYNHNNRSSSVICHYNYDGMYFSRGTPMSCVYDSLSGYPPSTRFQANIFWSSRHVLKTSSARIQRKIFSSWRCLGRQKIVLLKTSSSRYVLKTSWRHVSKTSSRHLGDKQNVYWGYLHLRRIQNTLIKTQ